MNNNYIVHWKNDKEQSLDKMTPECTLRSDSEHNIHFNMMVRKSYFTMLGAIQVLRNAFFLEIWPPPTPS